MGVLGDTLGQRVAGMSGNVLAHLTPVQMAYNTLDHRTLHGHAPNEAQGSNASAAFETNAEGKLGVQRWGQHFNATARIQRGPVFPL